MRNDYITYIINNLLKLEPLSHLNRESDKCQYLCDRLKNDMTSNDSGLRFGIEINMSIICHFNKIVFKFFPKHEISSNFIREYIVENGFVCWEYDNQTDDNMDNENFEEISKFWNGYFGEFNGSYKEISPIFTILDVDDAYILANGIITKMNEEV